MTKREFTQEDYVLFQEEWKHDPFWMLVACSLVNLTHWKMSKPVFNWIRDITEGNISSLASMDPEQLHDRMKPLGMWRQRSERLPKMARAYLQNPPKAASDVLKLPGCGKYAHDSWAIFVDGRTDVVPTDKNLNWYLDKISK